MPELPSEENLKILLIDDDEDDYLLIKDLLSEIKDVKYQIEWVNRFDKAKETIADPSFDVCLLDYRLGELTGLDLLQDGLKLGCKFPFILLTGHGDREIDLKAMKTGASDFLVKANLTSQLLERSVRYAIYRKKTEAQIIVQDRMASVGLLASGLAHEIGTPIGVIKGRAELLKTQSTSPEVKATADIIVGQIDRISKLVRSLLNLARGAKVENLGAVGINKPVEEVLELMQHEFRKNGIDVKNELQPDVRVAVTAQAEPLHQVILNLLINSVHAIETSKTRAPTQKQHFIRISTRATDENWILDIEDSGCGIPKAHLGSLFKPFFTTKDIGVGTGLGLATSYNIVKSWGGAISVVSTEGRGTTFSVALPKAK